MGFHRSVRDPSATMGVRNVISSESDVIARATSTSRRQKFVPAGQSTAPFLPRAPAARPHRQLRASVGLDDGPTHDKFRVCRLRRSFLAFNSDFVTLSVHCPLVVTASRVSTQSHVDLGSYAEMDDRLRVCRRGVGSPAEPTQPPILSGTRNEQYRSWVAVMLFRPGR